MEKELLIFNSLGRRKEKFEPVDPPFVGMYVCGPTVYGDAHLGHARPAITFDLVFRFLTHLGYKVRYVRNITDVGHLEGDADEGADKIGKKARLDKLEPMEVVQKYTNSYHDNMDQLNLLRPSIEPHASGHIIEQIEMIKKIMEAGYAYEVEGSVYFDIEKYNKDFKYGVLSGRNTEELISYTRELEGQEHKKNSIDFALWKKATPEHLMRWTSPWSVGYPGWHLECSTMGSKYLGDFFDIHGGGMDLLFPHHESEIAQSQAANKKMPVKYWMHNNMITINGQKMGKSLGNAVALNQFFSGDHELLDKAYSPMTIRFFILQAHYRSTLDFSNEALQASEKGYKKLMDAFETLNKLEPSELSTVSVSELEEKCLTAMLDDLNSPVAIAHLFEGVRLINSIKSGAERISGEDLGHLKKLFNTYIMDILGLRSEAEGSGEKGKVIGKLMGTILKIRQDARARKDFQTSDAIRDELQKINILIKDTRDGTDWKIDD
jgi:cysteinyl-tRNA synthetase